MKPFIQQLSLERVTQSPDMQHPSEVGDSVEQLFEQFFDESDIQELTVTLVRDEAGEISISADFVKKIK